MYVPQTEQTCRQAPWDANNGAAARQSAWDLTQAIGAAQGVFDLSVRRPDLDYGGWPVSMPDFDAVANGVEDFVGGAAAVYVPIPGKYEGGGGGVPNANPATSRSNPRVVKFPYCSPITTAQRRVPLVPAEGCAPGTISGNFVSTVNSAAYPTEIQPGNGVSGLGACGAPMVCAGNPAYVPGGFNAGMEVSTLSPAERARRGSGIPWWLIALGAFGVYSMTAGGDR